MPCLPIPKPPIPSLPAGLNFTVPLPIPPIPNVPNPCCLLPNAPVLKIPNPLGPLIVNPGVVNAIRAALEAAEAYFDSIPLDCPRG